MGFDCLTRPELIFPNLSGGDRAAVLTSFANLLADRGAIDDPADLFRRLEEREELGSTGIGAGVAIPHCKLEGLDRLLVAVGTCANDIDYDAADGDPVRVLFLVVSPHDSPAEHLQCLATISKWVKHEYEPDRMLSARNPGEIYDLLTEVSTST